ncbi:hypothetical protein [Bacillus sp. V3-13]|uniref:hypothetical protein n=1 Tax=Bacillus sp. V3-13 TaxID=2053728 RepID=UPI0021537188|nr:hypothetical protein [Bacillus sp. V3-13]
MAETFALYLSLVMAIFLFAFAYFEAIKISNADGKICGGTFILSLTSGFIFSGFTHIFL